MAKLSTVPRNPIQSVLVYGPPKAGKTQLVSELAAEFNLLWVDLENGHATLFKLPEEQQANVELVALPDTRSYPIAVETCLKMIKGNRGWVDNETGKWIESEGKLLPGKEYTEVWLNNLDKKWVVVFDSLTQFTNSAISNITRGQPDDYKMQHDDWGNLAVIIDKFLSQIQNAKFNCVCISHETETEMVDGKMKINPVAGSRNSSRNAAKYFGHVVHVTVHNKKHIATSSTTGSLSVVSGSRTDIATEKMDKPSLIPIFKGEVGSAPQTNGQKAANSLLAKYTTNK